jgi:hypothetical protein
MERKRSLNGRKSKNIIIKNYNIIIKNYNIIIKNYKDYYY